VFGTPVYGGTAQGATAVGTYAISVSGLYSNQLGYDIVSYVDGTLTIAAPPPIIPPPKISTRMLSELVDILQFGVESRGAKSGSGRQRQEGHGVKSRFAVAPTGTPKMVCQ
jgi:hypothetical protein